MFKVNSKKAINKLVKSSLKEYKMRNIFTLITIVLSVSLIAGFAFFSSAVEETNRKELSLRQHVIYDEVNEAQIESIKQNTNVLYSRDFKRGKSFEVDDYILSPSYIEQNDSNFLKTSITYGTYPNSINEVLVYEEMLDKMGIEPKIGETVSFSFLDGTTEEFIISGLTKSETDTDVFPIYFSRDYAINGAQLKDVPFSLAVQIVDAENLSSDEFTNLIKTIGSDNNVELKDINPNNAFVSSLSFNSREIMILALLAIIVLFISVFVIYSIFYISVCERTRQFGQLRTIGMTKKQIKRMVRREGTILSIIGSIMGIIVGSLCAYSMRPKGFNLVEFIILTIAIICANLITVQLSISKPAKLAASVSPIEASKLSGYEKKSTMTNKLKRNLSPLGLSMISTRGNRKKSIMTIISLSIAGIIFMCASTFVSSASEEKYSRQSNMFAYGDFIIDISSNAIQVNKFGETGIKKDNPLSSHLIEKLTAIDNVKEVFAKENLDLTYSYNSETQDDIAVPFTKNDVSLIEKYLKEGNINYDDMVKNKEIIIVHNEIAKEIFGWDFKLHDTVHLKWYDGEKYVEDDFKIAGIMKNSSKFYNNSDMYKLAYGAGWFMMPKDLLTQMMIPDFNLNSKIIVSCNDYEKHYDDIETQITSITDSNPLLSLLPFKEELKHQKEQYAILYATFMGASLFVIAFSVINLINTLISNTMARKREFACLASIGATNKQIITMIIGEGLYFSVINLVTTLTIGTAASYIMIKIMILNGIRYVSYVFPLLYIIAYSAFVLIIPLVLSFIIAKIINKKSLIERLREVE